VRSSILESNNSISRERTMIATTDRKPNQSLLYDRDFHQ
jgi:hypothetical protein